MPTKAEKEESKPYTPNCREYRAAMMSIGIGQQILSTLRVKGLYPPDLAKLLGVKPAVVYKWLDATHNFTIQQIAAIEEVLETDLVFLWDDLSDYVLKRDVAEAKLRERHQPIRLGHELPTP